MVRLAGVGSLAGTRAIGAVLVAALAVSGCDTLRSATPTSAPPSPPAPVLPSTDPSQASTWVPSAAPPSPTPVLESDDWVPTGWVSINPFGVSKRLPRVATRWMPPDELRCPAGSTSCVALQVIARDGCSLLAATVLVTAVDGGPAETISASVTQVRPVEIATLVFASPSPAGGHAMITDLVCLRPSVEATPDADAGSG